MAEINDSTIEQLASQPKQATVDGVTVSQHSLPEMIAALEYLAKRKVASKPLGGIKFAKVVPPASVSQR